MKKLNQSTVQLITSSQVITSIFSVVKELVENSLDAGAFKVDVKLVEYGLEIIEVSDNGSGIEKEYINVACLPHYTSKISSIDDLQALNTYGFRGEALYSLCSLATIAITTKTREDNVASTYTFLDDGKLDELNIKPSAGCDGTTVVVTNLFKNVPVRKQYYRNEKRLKEDLKKIEILLMGYSIACPKIRFSLVNNLNNIFSKNSFKDAKDVLRFIWGPIAFNAIQHVHVNEPQKDIKLEMFLPTVSNATEKCFSSEKSFIIVNNRPVVMYDIDKLIKDKIRLLSISQTICYCVIINISSAQIDVNIEPNKSRVLFHQREHIFKILVKILNKLYTIDDMENNETTVSNEDIEKGKRKGKILISESTEAAENVMNMDTYFRNKLQRRTSINEVPTQEFRSENITSAHSLNKSGDESLLNKTGSSEISILNDSSFENNWKRGNLRTHSNVLLEPVQVLSKTKRALSPLKECNMIKKKCLTERRPNMSFSNLNKNTSSAYMMYARDIRKAVIDENPTVDFMRINRIISQKWDTLDQEQRGKYEKNFSKPRTRKQNTAKSDTLEKVEQPRTRKSIKNDIRIVKINFDLEKLNTKNKLTRQPSVFNVIGKLKDGLWLINFQNCIGTWNQSQSKATELYNNLVEHHQLIPKSLDQPLVLTEGLVGGHEQWMKLISLSDKQDYGIFFYVTDDRIVNNGIKVRKWQDSITNFVHAEITHITDCLSFYGVNDLKEILTKIVTDNNITIAQSRPLQVVNYFKAEVARLSRQFPIGINKSQVQVSVEYALKRTSYLTEYLCIYDHQIFTPFYDLAISEMDLDDDFNDL